MEQSLGVKLCILDSSYSNDIVDFESIMFVLIPIFLSRDPVMQSSRIPQRAEGLGHRKCCAQLEHLSVLDAAGFRSKDSGTSPSLQRFEKVPFAPDWRVHLAKCKYACMSIQGLRARKVVRQAYFGPTLNQVDRFCPARESTPNHGPRIPINMKPSTLKP